MHADAPDRDPREPAQSSASEPVATSDTLAVDWDLSQVDGTTLVTVRVTNMLAHPRQLRIDNRLDGPVSPPRKRGLPDSTGSENGEANEHTSWDADGVSVSVAPEETVSVGYACRAPPQTPPVTVRDGADVPNADPVDRALRSLGDHAPPRAALSAVSTTAGSAAEDGCPAEVENEDENGIESEDTDGGGVGSENESEQTRGVDDETPRTSAPTRATSNAAQRPAPSAATAGSAPAAPSRVDDVPHPIAAWFDAVEARLDTAEQLSGSVPEATPVIASLGGRAGLETLAATMRSDEQALRRVIEEATTLADRLDETAVPVVEAER